MGGARKPGRPGQLAFDVTDLNGRPIGQHHQPLDHVLVLADVAGPSLGGQTGQGALGEGHVGPAVVLAEAGAEVASQGVDVGGPSTSAAGSTPDDPMAGELLAIEGVISMFATADFITLSKTPDSSWESIAPAAQSILERYFE